MIRAAQARAARKRYRQIAPVLNEWSRRRFVALEARALGRGGVSLMARITRLAPPFIMVFPTFAIMWRRRRDVSADRAVGKRTRFLRIQICRGMLHPLQQAFVDHDAFRFGDCSPAEICSADKRRRAGGAGIARTPPSTKVCRGEAAQASGLLMLARARCRRE